MVAGRTFDSGESSIIDHWYRPRDETHWVSMGEMIVELVSSTKSRTPMATAVPCGRDRAIVMRPNAVSCATRFDRQQISCRPTDARYSRPAMFRASPGASREQEIQ
jgi:hypothetical protein